ncbi:MULTISPECIES: hypothetical protein [Enterococcus]|uniref:hypothetical protein n=1 Tax=Enterococcus TaxID=1350 RepID=UPI0022E857C8|nr:MULTISPECIES: hypothetical protein [Enterococcus]MDN6916826.1 hypothetical protein [Enterococcus faecium]HBL5604327.1 hypothetical protein [Enterococcus faecium]
MNEKIQNLIKELAAKCANDDLGMSVSVVDEKGEVVLGQAGNDSLVAWSVYRQYEKTKRDLQNNNCNCETHGTLKQLFGIEYEDPEFEEWYQDFLRFAEKMDRKKGGIKF